MRQWGPDRVRQGSSPLGTCSRCLRFVSRAFLVVPFIHSLPGNWVQQLAANSARTPASQPASQPSPPARSCPQWRPASCPSPRRHLSRTRTASGPPRARTAAGSTGIVMAASRPPAWRLPVPERLLLASGPSQGGSGRAGQPAARDDPQLGRQGARTNVTATPYDALAQRPSRVQNL